MISNSSHSDSAFPSTMCIPVVISAPYVYLTQAVVEQLFCDRYRLHKQTALSQADQYLAQETVTLIGPQGQLDHVHVVGPPRSVSQVEISRSAELLLGIEGAARGIRIRGPRTSVMLDCGVIRAERHVLMNPIFADQLGLKDHDCVDVARASKDGRTLFRGVVIRVSPDYRVELHLSTDDAIVADMHSGEHVVIRDHSMRRARVAGSQGVRAAMGWLGLD